MINTTGKEWVFHAFYAKKKKIYADYVSKHNSNFQKQAILFMISNREGWHYLVAKKLSALLRGIMSSYHGDFYCSIVFILLQQKTSLNRVKKYVRKKIF